MATDWDPQRTYAARNENAESNPFMRAIYDEDQQARKDQLTMSPAQWEALTKEDAARQQRTRALLASEQLHSGEDFRQAAFIFQHGTTPEDFLLAHTLAMVAVSKGDDTAVWIGAATLDRYLQSIDRPQVYGTQFRNESNEPGTQEPYNRTLISDSLRLELGVPPLEAQQGSSRHCRNRRARKIEVGPYVRRPFRESDRAARAADAEIAGLVHNNLGSSASSAVSSCERLRVRLLDSKRFGHWRSSLHL